MMGTSVPSIHTLGVTFSCSMGDIPKAKRKNQTTSFHASPSLPLLLLLLLLLFLLLLLLLPC
jgi:hypothetical protein